MLCFQIKKKKISNFRTPTCISVNMKLLLLSSKPFLSLHPLLHSCLELNLCLHGISGQDDSWYKLLWLRHEVMNHVYLPFQSLKGQQKCFKEEY